MGVADFVDLVVKALWCLPILFIFFFAAVYLTFKLGFVQFRYFFKSIKMLLQPQKTIQNLDDSQQLSPFQAFMNTLGANIGNGALAGVGVAIFIGGPGSIFWMMLFTLFAVVFRYAEVFLSTYVIGKYSFAGATGGPMVYLSRLPFGFYISYFYTFLALLFVLIGGNLTQCHAVGLAVHKSFGIEEYITAFFVLLFIGYVVIGGTKRIVDVLNKLVPLKVGLFLISAIIVLLYHYQTIPTAFYLMVYGAFNPQAFVAGSFVFALQQSLAVGFQRAVFASEAGIGTSGIAFSNTSGDKSVQNALMSTIGVYITVHVVCLLVALCILASGVWNNGETSAALLISAYQTVFGSFAGAIITILAVNFAVSVVVASAYLGKECWRFLFKDKYVYLFSVLYMATSFIGTCMEVALVWNLNNLINIIALFVNVLGLLWFSNIIKDELLKYGEKDGLY